MAVILKKSGHLSFQSAQRRWHRLRVRETGFDPGCSPAHGWSAAANPMRRDREMESSLHALPVPPPSPCQPSPHGRPCRQLSGPLTTVGWGISSVTGPRCALGPGLGGGCCFPEPCQGHPQDLKARRALTWTPRWPSCLHWLSDGRASLRSLRCDRLQRWERGRPQDLPSCCPCHDVGRKLGR